MKIKLGLLILALSLVACNPTPQSKVGTPTKALDNTSASDVKSNNSNPTPMTDSLTLLPADQLLKLNAGQSMQAVIKTNMGNITVDLYADKTPKTVGNFVGLSEGTQSWMNPKTGNLEEGTPLYKGVVFHRIITDFMIQGGDPLGTGTGGPGYRFADEIVDGLSFSEPGILAMANAGPGTNGSQFFITTVPTPWLNGKHTIFGKVVTGMDVVKKIEAVETGAQDRPLTPVTIESIEIVRK